MKLQNDRLIKQCWYKIDLADNLMTIKLLGCDFALRCAFIDYVMQQTANSFLLQFLNTMQLD